MERVAEAEEFAGFGGGDASVDGEAIEMIEALARRPGGEGLLAELGETLLEAVEIGAGEGIARGNGTTSARIAAFEREFPDFEADNTALVRAEELILPERGNAIDFEGSAEALAGFVENDARKPIAKGLERSGGDDCGAVGDGIIGETVGRVADEELLLEEDAEPFGGVIVSLGKSEGARWDVAAITGNGKGNAAQIRGEGGADEVHGGGALGVHPFAIEGEESPGAVQGQSTGRADSGLGEGDRIKRFDGVETNADETWVRSGSGHEKSLAGAREDFL